MTVSGTPGETVKVLAPINLNEGYILDVTLDGETFAVTVPSGGAREGEYFDGIITSEFASVPPADPCTIAALSDEYDYAGRGLSVSATNPAASASVMNKTTVQNPDGTQTVTEETTYPDGTTTKTVTTSSTAAAPPFESWPPQPSIVDPNVRVVPLGAVADVAPTAAAWRHGLFECCDLCGNGMFWMSWCCTYIAMGQLLQRMKLNPCGQPGEYERTCMTWTIIYAVSIALYWVIVAATQGYGVFVYAVLSIISIVALTQVRYFMRRKWGIRADCCEDSGALSDCCCVYWCSCCSMIQMLRHTHDERVYFYNCGSPTGLDMGAPEVV